MKRSHHHFLCIALTVLLICIILVPCVSAAAKTKTPTPTTPPPTVPPILQACSQARIPTANFTCNFPGDTSAPTPDGPPYTIKCIDNSSAEFNQSVVSWKWDFGDGGSSTDQNPEHTYSDVSRYDITLTATTFCGSQYTNTTSGSITIYCSVPEPGFSTNVTEGYAPLAVEVTDSSLRTRDDITRWTYWFDTTHSSNERDPVFVYTTPGTYTINQTVWKDCIQLGSNSYPPATRQIIVKPRETTTPAVNGTNVTPTVRRTGAAPAGTTPVVTSGAPGPVAGTTPVKHAGVPGTGTLSVTTDPAGAQVFIDGVPQGITPATIPNIAVGSHTLRFEREGYTQMTVPVVQITDGTITTFSTALTPEPTGIALLPVIAMGIIILGIIIGGAYLYLKQRAENLED